jgi:hypothetical protein
MQYIKEQPGKATSNTNTYTMASNKAKINAVEAAFPEFFNDTDTEQEREERLATLAHLFHHLDNDDKTK